MPDAPTPLDLDGDGSPFTPDDVELCHARTITVTAHPAPAWDEEAVADEFSRHLAAHDAEIREQTLAPIRAALAGHLVCDVHPDGDPVSCGWKRAVADVRRALDA